MNLTKRLLSYLHRVFDKDPAPFLALRLNCDGSGMTWAVSNGRLTTTPVGGTAAPLSVDLTQYTVASLAGYLTAQTGYTVSYFDATQLSLLGAAVLMDGSGNVAQSNGDHLYGYTSVLWSYMEANAVELKAAEAQIGNMLLQMSTTTAEDIWLDELGGYYKVPRNQGELDAQYGPRIIAQVLRPLGNNVAIESALRVINNGLPVSVDDYDTIVNNSYGQFDVNMTVSLEFLAVAAYATLLLSITDTIDKMRDAGTFLRRIAILTGVHADYYAASGVISGETVSIYPDLTPSLMLDFTAEGRSYPGLVCGRTGTATRWNSSGVLESVAPNTLRISRDRDSGQMGLLIEQERTNSIRNNTMVGAVAGGSFPTNWSQTLAGPGVSSASVSGVGIEDGISYIDFAITRTSSASSSSITIYFDEYNAQAAVPNSKWTSSVFVRRLSGTLVPTQTSIRIGGVDGAGVGLGTAGNLNVTPTTSSLSGQRHSMSTTLSNASTAFVRSWLVISIPAGGDDSFIMRVGLPQLELGSAPTSTILTAGSAVSRAAENVSMLTGEWFNASEGVMLLTCKVGVVGFSLGQFSAAKLWSSAAGEISTRLDASFLNFNVIASSVTQADLDVFIPSLAQSNKLAGAYKANDFIAAVNGQIGSPDTNGSVPAAVPNSRLYLGPDASEPTFSVILIHHFEYHPRRLTNAQLQFLTM